ncbi:hypothetical protein [Nonomuraea sp. NPDC049400]
MRGRVLRREARGAVIAVAGLLIVPASAAHDRRQARPTPQESSIA